MARAPDWTEGEFDTLLENSACSGQELAGILAQRTPDAIAVVRQGIHSYHGAGNVSMLSKMMLRKLEERKGSLTCPLCQAQL